MDCTTLQGWAELVEAAEPGSVEVTDAEPYRVVYAGEAYADASPPKPPLPRPERIEPWQVWQVADVYGGAMLVTGILPEDVEPVSGIAVNGGRFHMWAENMLRFYTFLGWFKPRISSRTWTGRVPLQAGLYRITEAGMLDTTNGEWLPDGNPTDADIAEWRETWGRT